MTSLVLGLSIGLAGGLPHAVAARPVAPARTGGGHSGRTFRGSKDDEALSGYGDGEGYHLQLATEDEDFVWRDVAVLRPADLDESTWYGYQCLSGDGRYAAVTVLPGGLVNLPEALMRGAYAYGVDLESGAVTPLLSGVSFQYSSPGCGTGSAATFTASLDDSQGVTSIAVVDLAAAEVSWSAVVAGQVTSAVPSDDAQVIGASGGSLVAFGPGGSDAAPQTPGVLADLGAQGYDVRPTGDGTVDLLTWVPGSSTSTLARWDGETITELGSGPLEDVLLAGGRDGHDVVVGLDDGDPTTADVQATDATPLSAAPQVVSLDGDAVFATDVDADESTGGQLSQVMSTSTSQVLSAGQMANAPPVAASTTTSDVALPGIELTEPVTQGDAFPTSETAADAAAGSTAGTPRFGGTTTTGTGILARTATAVTAAATAATTPKCGVPRLDPTRQALQPSPAQVDWAVQMAEQGLLTGTAYTRPAGYANMGLAAYAPSSDFARISLHHPAGTTWDTVPRSVMEAVMAQESNFDQASWHALPGIAGGPLVGNYYGASGSIRTIDYTKADCGYGIAQVTTGMAASETSITVNGKAKVAVDYEENVAAGLRILQQSWNTLYDAGITANGGDPRYLENWYLAIWAYNSGIQPTAAYGNTTGCTPSATCTGPDGTWGLGWSNNPVNPSYPPSRAAYLRTTYADAAHPADWPYQERVMGWMASPIIRLSHAAYAKPDYHGGQSWLQLPARTAFCTSANLCDPTYVDPANAAHTICTLGDYECWWHQPVTWVTSCSTTCATSAYAVTTGSTEPTYTSPHPPTCTVDARTLPTTSHGAPIIVDDLATPSQNRQGCTGTAWSNGGTFTLTYGTDASGQPTGQIDTHQLGAGFGGHIYFTHTEAAGDTAVTNTGTWTPVLPSLQYYTVKIHIPATGAAATDVVYTINPGGGASPWRIRVNQAWGSEQWVTIGTFAMQNGATVQLSNTSQMAAGTYDVAYDAIAFLPQGGTPGQPIGGPPGVKDAPRGSNPAWVSCGCAQRTAGDPVSTLTGSFGESYTDLSTPGRGTALEWTRSYDSALADPAGPDAADSVDGAFGHGWSSTVAITATTDPGTGGVVVHQEDGSQVAFMLSGGVYTPASPRFDATLTLSGGAYTYTRRGQDVFVLDAATGHLTKETDLAGTQAVPPYWTTFAYDTGGHLATATDPEGRVDTVTWTGTHITGVTDPAGRRVDYAYSAAGDLTDVGGIGTVRSGSTRGEQDHATYTYDAHHLLTTVRTPANVGSTATPSPVTTTAYDTSERVTSQTDPVGRVTTFTYGPAGGLTAGQTRVVDPAGHATVDTYQNGLLVSETRGEGTTQAGTWSYTYDPVTLGVTTVSDPLGHVSTATYDDHGNRISTSDALGSTTSYQYDDHGRVVLTTDPTGTQTAASYTAAGMLAATSTGRPGQTAEVSDGNPVDPTVRTTSRAYADTAHPGDLTSSTDARGKVTTYAYDTAGDLVRTTDPLGDVTLARYDLSTGDLLATVTPLGAAAGTTATCTTPATGCTTVEHDAHGRATVEHDPTGHTTTTTYDADGHVTATTDADGRTTSTAYDPAGQALSTTAPDGTVMTTTYTGDGQVASTTDALGAVTTTSYDGQGRRTSTTDPVGRTTTTTYDTAGDVATIVAPDGRITTYTSDAAGRVVAVAYSDHVTPGVTSTYDSLGRRVTMTDGTGTTTSTYDAFGELTRRVDGSGAVVAYGYDETGDVTSLTYPGAGRTVTRAYDDTGRLTRVTDWNGRASTFAYDADGALVTISAGNGTTVSVGHDGLGAMSSTTLARGTTTLAAITYDRDADGSVTDRASTGALTQGAQTFGYDAQGRIVSASGPAAAYAYDAAGDPTTFGPTTQAFDAAGTLCWSGVGAGTCTVPAAGATVVTSTADGQRASSTTGSTVSTYTWDQAGRLTGATTPAGTVGYRYDGDGMRVAVTTGGTTRSATWDTQADVPLLLDDGTTAYVYGPGGAPLEQVAGGSTQWFFSDAQGSTVALTDASGTVSGTYTYDPWGQVTAHTGTSTALQYGGQQCDGPTGFLYLRARYYDPATGVFLSIDPLVGATLAAYLYAGDDPLDGIDPLGLSWWNPWSWSAKTRTVVGITLGAVALAATGVGLFADLGMAGAVAVDAVAFGTGAAAAALDYDPCVHGHEKVACGGLALGAIGTGYGGLALGADAAILSGGSEEVWGPWVTAGGVGGLMFGGTGLGIDVVGAVRPQGCEP